jgi:hypothetical protein
MHETIMVQPFVQALTKELRSELDARAPVAATPVEASGVVANPMGRLAGAV